VCGRGIRTLGRLAVRHCVVERTGSVGVKGRGELLYNGSIINLPVNKINNHYI